MALLSSSPRRRPGAAVLRPDDGQCASLFAVEHTEEAERAGVELIEEEERKCYFRAHRAVVALLQVRQFEGDAPLALTGGGGGGRSNSTRLLSPERTSGSAPRHLLLISPIRDAPDTPGLASGSAEGEASNSRRLDFDDDRAFSAAEPLFRVPLPQRRWLAPAPERGEGEGPRRTAGAVPAPRYAWPAEPQWQPLTKVRYSAVAAPGRLGSVAPSSASVRLTPPGDARNGSRGHERSGGAEGLRPARQPQPGSSKGGAAVPAPTPAPASYGAPLGFHSRVLRANVSAIFTLQPDRDCPYPIAEGDCLFALGSAPLLRLSDLERWDRRTEASAGAAPHPYITVIRHGKKYLVRLSSAPRS